ncbi:uncharacterized protein LOC135204551 [Macrobrachium nipponense]|uniref:uncharacterized protein LOC135204551 n=1 Tax=Macrobrachium nipponense TaxID=159736 RepID=UPI0030C7B776
MCISDIENPRLQRLKEKISPYFFTAVWRAGKSLNIPDAVSQAPVSHPAPEDKITGASSATHLQTIMAVYTVTSSGKSPAQDANRTLQDLRDTAREDPVYTHLLNCVTLGFPSNRYDLHNSLLPYRKIQDKLYADDELSLQRAKVIVPAALCCRMLSRLHDSHQGMESSKCQVRQAVFWPGINSDIVNTIVACESCGVLQPTQKQEPSMNDDNLTRPCESVSSDLFTVTGKAFLVILDRL